MNMHKPAGKIPKYLRVWMVVLLFACPWVHSSPNLSFSKIRYLYVEGEFDAIQAYLEAFLRHSEKSATHKERVFAYKYLGVVYAAGPQGYPLAESYFHQMLTLAPKAHLSDLYVSSAVEALFQKTRERYHREHGDHSGLDGSGKSRRETETDMTPTMASGDNPNVEIPHSSLRTAPPPTKPMVRKKVSRVRVWPYLIGIGVAGAVGGFYWLSIKDKPDQVVDARPGNP